LKRIVLKIGANKYFYAKQKNLLYVCVNTNIKVTVYKVISMIFLPEIYTIFQLFFYFC